MKIFRRGAALNNRPVQGVAGIPEERSASAHSHAGHPASLLHGFVTIPLGAENPYAAAADDWAAAHDYEEAPETEEEAAERLYDLALAFQERSQQTEAHLLEQFEAAASALTSVLGDLIVVDDEDERLTLRASGAFAAEVVPEEEEASGQWRKLDGPDEIVEFYDPTDIFGDLADALAEAFPDLAEEAPSDAGTEDNEGEAGAHEEGDHEAGEEGQEGGGRR